MENVIKWQLRPDCPMVHSSEPIARLEVAVVEACPLLGLHPHAIWIECSDGRRIETAELARRCEGWASPRLALQGTFEGDWS